MTDISTAVMAAMNNLVASGKIEAAIEKQLDVTIADLIRQHLQSYSEFGKALSAHIKTSIGVNLERVTLPEYNAVIADLVRRKVDEFIQKDGREALDETLKELLKAAPPTLKFSELVEEFKEWAVEHYDCDPEHSEITIHVEDSGGRYTSRWVYMDRKPSQRKYDCEFSFLLSGDDTVSNIRLRGRSPKEDLFIGGYYGFERSLFRLHAAKTKLIVDSFDTTMPEREAA